MLGVSHSRPQRLNAPCGFAVPAPTSLLHLEPCPSGGRALTRPLQTRGPSGGPQAVQPAGGHCWPCRPHAARGSFWAPPPPGPSASSLRVAALPLTHPLPGAQSREDGLRSSHSSSSFRVTSKKSEISTRVFFFFCFLFFYYFEKTSVTKEKRADKRMWGWKWCPCPLIQIQMAVPLQSFGTHPGVGLGDHAVAARGRGGPQCGSCSPEVCATV